MPEIPWDSTNYKPTGGNIPSPPRAAGDAELATSCEHPRCLPLEKPGAYSLLNVSPALRTTLRRNSMRAVTSSSTKFRAASMTVLRRD